LSTKVSFVGVYSTGSQRGQITGAAQLGSSVSDWLAGAVNSKRAAAMCSSSFSGGKVLLVQYPSSGFDADHACP
jgi:hypothetical protein